MAGVSMQTPPNESSTNRYAAIIERIFHDRYSDGDTSIGFQRQDIIETAQALEIDLPLNLGDVIYSFRYRTPLPSSIQALSAEGNMWIIRPAGRGLYQFSLVPILNLAPNRNLAITKVPDSTPGVVIKYSQGDEQSLLARLRYNRVIDVATGLTCYSLQNHFRTSIPNIGQVETDEIYVGIDKRGAHYVIPVQAKSGADSLSIVQIEQDFYVCEARFSSLIAKPIGAQFIDDQTVAIFEFERSDKGIRVSAERHYQLVEPDQVTENDLQTYRQRLIN